MLGGMASRAVAGEATRPLKHGNIAIVNFAAVYRFKAISKNYGSTSSSSTFPAAPSA
jgi:hypothetical protein